MTKNYNGQEIFLSVVIPCKNEGRNISRCLTSILKEVKNIEKNTEILLADSFSTDKTIEIAKEFPVNTIQLKPDWPQSPAAARYLGCLNTEGKYIFIIDADMELLPGFLKKAIDFMEKNHEIAGVAGMGSERYEEGGKLDDFYKRHDQFREVNLLAGAALFRRSALDKAGYFNPYLQSEEEHELSQRLKKHGFKLFSLPYPMTIHYTSQSMKKFLHRLRAGLFFGIGQMLRLSLAGNFSLFTLLRFKWFFLFICSIPVFVGINLYIFVLKDYSLFIYEAIMLLSLWLFICIIKGGFKKSFLSIFKQIAINISIIRGFMKKVENPSTYPQDVTVIRKGIIIGHE